MTIWRGNPNPGGPNVIIVRKNKIKTICGCHVSNLMGLRDKWGSTSLLVYFFVETLRKYAVAHYISMSLWSIHRGLSEPDGHGFTKLTSIIRFKCNIKWTNRQIDQKCKCKERGVQVQAVCWKLDVTGDHWKKLRWIFLFGCSSYHYIKKGLTLSKI